MSSPTTHPPQHHPQTNQLFDPDITFPALCESLNLDPRLRKSLGRLKLYRPTLVQSKSLPLAIRSKRDLLVRARTGSGKTLAYTLPILQTILSSSSSYVKAVILVPTRELCHQVQSCLRDLTHYCDDVVTVVSLAGKGDDPNDDAAREAALRDVPDCVVATPAGLLGQVKSKTVDLGKVEILVLDEADLLLSFGYENDISEILKSLPKIYQGFLMSATLSPELESLKKIILHSPAVLKLEEEDAATSLKGSKGALSQFYLSVPKKDKQLVLYVFLKLGLLRGKGLFFVNTTNNAYRLKLFFEQFHIRSAVLNAELPLKSRLSIIDQFNAGNFEYLIATDESTTQQFSEEQEPSHKKRKKDSEYNSSRGLDFRGVSFVVNVDFPPTPETYTHRIGRTARAGAKGVALTLLTRDDPTEHSLLSRIQQTQPSVLPTSTTLAPTTPEPQPQPSPLDFDLREIEGFRYRVEDVSRAVTHTAIRETRAAEVKAELLNCEILEQHFEEHPKDLMALKHDRTATHVSKVQDHLKNVPEYLLPRGMHAVQFKKRKRRRRKTTGTKSAKGSKPKTNDPLQTFDEGENLDDFLDQNDDDVDVEEEDNSKEEKESKVFLHTDDGLGRSTSNRKKWQERNKKGKFGKKYLRKQRQFS